MDIREVTYTDSDGEQRNAYDYLMEDGGDIPGGRYATRCMDAAELAIMLHVILVHSNGPDCDTVENLDGAMSMVVNGSDEVCWTILDNRHALEDITVTIGGWGRPQESVPLDPTIYFDGEEIEYSRDLYSEAYDGAAPTF